MLNRIRNIFIILSLGLVVFSISYKVTPNYGGIGYNDSAYFWNLEKKTDSIISSYSSDYLGTPLLNSIFLYTPKGILVLILKKIGFNDFWISYVLSFGFIFIVSIISYFVFSKIANNKLFGFTISIFLIFNNISIEYIAFGQYYYYLYLLSLILIINIFYNIYNNNGTIKNIDIIKLSLISLLVILPINLVGYSLIIFLFYMFFYFKYGYKKEYIYKLFFSGLIIFIINLYWIIPFFIGLGNSSSGEIYGGNANGVLDGFSKMATYINIISFRQYFNTISIQLFDNFFVNIFYIGLVLLTFFIGFFTKIKEKIFIVFLLFIYLVFFNFALGPNSSITGDLYKYLWENYSFFSFFRSFTRFSIPLLVIIIFIISIYFSSLKSKKIINISSIVFLLLVLSLHNSLLTGNLKNILIAIKVPKEYTELNKYVRKDENILIYPNISYETYDWSIGKSKLQIQDYYLKEYIINAGVLYNRASLNLEYKNVFYNNIFSVNFSNTNLIDILNNKSSIKYILIQKKLINVFNGEKIPFEEYNNYFNYYGEKILDNEEFSLFKINNNSKILFNESNILYSKENSYKYNIKINFKKLGNIYFLENFNSNFKLYLKNKNGLFNNQLFEHKHKLVYDYANGWTISKDEIVKYVHENYSKELKKEGYPKVLLNGKIDYKYYTINPDESIDVELTIYFKPQSYFYLGIIISGTTFLILISYLGVDTIRNRRKNKLETIDKNQSI